MEHIAIEAKPRSASNSKGERKRLRRAGHIPAAVYGKGIAPTLLTVEARDVSKVLASQAGTNTLIDLTLNGQRHLVKMSELEVEPISRTLLHIGLHKIAANEAAKASVPVELVGEPEAVRLGDGLIESGGTLTVEVKSLPEQLPASVLLDISDMQIGDVKHVSDVVMPEGIELLSDPEAPLVSVRTAPTGISQDQLDAIAGDEEELTGVTNNSSSHEEALQSV
jgi:large subunit ribosomal protein L25